MIHTYKQTLVVMVIYGRDAGGRHPVEEELAFAGILLVTNILQYKVEKQNLRREMKKTNGWRS